MLWDKPEEMGRVTNDLALGEVISLELRDITTGQKALHT